MKKTLLALLALVSFVSLSAHAEQEIMERIEKPIWDCALTFKASGGGIQLVVGSYKLSGPGKIRCVDIAGNQQELDVKVTMGTSHFAPNLAIGRFHLAGIATGIGVANGPEALLGKYYTLGGEVAAVIGVGANLALHGGNGALTLNLGVNVLKGAGLQFGFNKVKIEALN